MTGTGAQARPVRMHRRTLSFALFRTRAVLLWERLYAALAPLFTVIAVFAGLALFGLWAAIPGWLHVLGCAAFVGAAVWAIVIAEPRLVMPSIGETRRRLESESGLPQGTLADLDDTPFTSAPDDPFWQAHHARIAATLKRLTPGRPRALIDETDPYAFRIPAALLLITGLVIAGPAAGNRIAKSMTPQLGTPEIITTDLWVDPPAYTRQPPKFLVRRDEMPTGEQPAFSVPEGSILRLRSGMADGKSPRVEFWANGEDGRERLSPDPDDLGAYAVELTESTSLTVRVGRRMASYPVEVIPDRKPSVRIIGEPSVEGGTRTLLTIDIDDDYGVTDGAVELRLAANVPRPPDAPPPPGIVPPATIDADALRGEPGTREVSLDLTEHPWAGLPVSLKIRVTDGAGHTAVTDARSIVLPERTFYNPLSKAVIEERRNLALAPQSWQRSLRLFDALTVAPELFAADAQEYLLLRTAYHDIDGGEGRNTDEVVASLWPLAIALEDEGLAFARQRLEAAQEALRNALAQGAPQEEIDRLVEELRRAMQDYVAALAASEDALAEENSGREQLEGRDLEDILDEIAELRRQGDSAAARQRLAELEEMLQNLRISSGGEGQQSQSGQSSSGNSMSGENGEGGEQGGTLGEAGDIIDQQRRLSDDTFDARRGGRDINRLSTEQQDLADAVRELTEQAGEDAAAASEDFDSAAQAMEFAAQAMRRGDLLTAGRAQEEAIGHLRNGATTLAEQALEEEQRRAGEGQGAGDGRSAAGQSADTDPLGRAYQQGATGIEIPDLSDPERVREITRELRERLRDPNLPQAEREYFERLLRRF